MRFRVTSGDFTLNLDRLEPKQAAIDALRIWNLNPNKPKLSMIVGVEGDSSKGEVLYASEEVLKLI